ncbi:hypothetical protein QOT17_012869 [Balamuthia mandrillaris]
MQDLIVRLDPNILNKEGGKILTALQDTPCQCKILTLAIPNSIEWHSLYTPGDDEEGGEEGGDHSEEANRHKEPTPVPQVLIKFTAEEFVGLVVDEQKLAEHVLAVQAAHPNKKITYLVEGMADFLRNNQKRRDRVLRQRILAANGGGSEEEEATGGRGAAVEPTITRAMVDRTAVWLQIEAKVHLHETFNGSDTADHILRMTKVIAEMPYRKESVFAAFCAEATQKRSSRTASNKEIWINQLKQISRVSLAAAMAIAEEYPSFRSLAHMYYHSALTEKKKKELLKDIVIEQVSGSRRTIGPALSEKIYRIFTETDGNLILH